jgi:hypothetical protein
MPALEIIGIKNTAPGATLAVSTPSSGDSFTIKNNGNDGRIFLADLWGKRQGAGYVRITSPRMHDNTNGIKQSIPVGALSGMIPQDVRQELISQDALNVYQIGSAVAGDVELAAMQIYYENLGGVNANLISPDELAARMKNLLTVLNSLTGGTTGDWGGEISIVTTEDQLKANTDYAVLGCTVNIIAGAIGYKSPDFGNLRVGVPGTLASALPQNNYFVDLSYRRGLPCIPVFNSANKNSTLVSVQCDENGGTFLVESFLAELK